MSSDEVREVIGREDEVEPGSPDARVSLRAGRKMTLCGGEVSWLGEAEYKPKAQLPNPQANQANEWHKHRRTAISICSNSTWGDSEQRRNTLLDDPEDGLRSQT